MGLVNYANVHFFSVFALGWPVVHKKMPVHDWLWDDYGHNEHSFQCCTDPSPEHGSGVFKDYIGGVEKRGINFTKQ